jgi:chitodextrinase
MPEVRGTVMSEARWIVPTRIAAVGAFAVACSLLLGLWHIGTASAANPRQTTVQGTLELRHSDDFRAKVASYQYFLSTGSRRVRLDVGRHSRVAANLAGKKVRVRGKRRGSRLRVSSLRARRSARAAALPAPTQRRAAVILFNFQNDTRTPVTQGGIRGTVFTNSNSVNEYYKEQSSGTVSLTGKFRSDGDVYGWFTIPYDNTSCSYSTWASAARAAAEASDGDSTNGTLSGYNHYIYACPSTSACRWAGLAEISGSRSWINGSFNLRIIGHELGHNLSANHSSSMSCTDSNGRRVSISDRCTVSEYGDPFDIMGSSARHKNNYQKMRINFLDRLNSRTVTAEGDYTLAASEHDLPGQVQAIRIPRTRNSDGSVRDYYYLDLRQPFGIFDAFNATDPAVNGVAVRIAYDYTSFSQPRLLDGTPETGSFSDAPLPVGRTFYDSTANVSVTNLGIAADPLDGLVKATVRIVVAADSTPPSAPTILTASAPSPNRVNLSWSAATDNVGVAGYDVYRNGTRIGSSTTTSYSDTTVSARTTYTYHVVARDFEGNVGPASNQATVTTPDVDSVAPSVTISTPANGAIVSGTVGIAASASDNVGVTRMEVLIDGAVIATSNSGSISTNWNTRPKSVATGQHTILVRAYDAQGNVGTASIVVTKG